MSSAEMPTETPPGRSAAEPQACKYRHPRVAHEACAWQAPYTFLGEKVCRIAFFQLTGIDASSVMKAREAALAGKGPTVAWVRPAAAAGSGQIYGPLWDFSDAQLVPDVASVQDGDQALKRLADLPRAAWTQVERPSADRRCYQCHRHRSCLMLAALCLLPAALLTAT